jgi:4'-phosphopantetheinyl transferase
LAKLTSQAHPFRAGSSALAGSWLAPPLELPELSERTVHLWRAELDDEHAASLGGLLTSAERARATRILGDRKRELWMRARGVLRSLLGAYVGVDARALRLTTNAGGKPTLSEHPPVATVAGGTLTPARLGERRPCGVAFNVSHTATLGLFGFVCSGEIGVDVELIGRARLDELALAARMLGRGEAKRLGELEPELRRREFLRAWTRREAQAKWSGAGLAATGEPWLGELDMGPACVAAVALSRTPEQLLCWDWNASRLLPFGGL